MISPCLDPASAADRVEELSAELRRAEEEIRSLSAEIVERYEEATLVYRLSQGLGSVLGEEAIARLVLDDAARVLGAGAGEIWLVEEESLVLVASVPAGASDRDCRERVGAGEAMAENRPWTREAGERQASVVAVPLPSPSGDPLGALVLRGRRDRRSYRSSEVKLLTALAALTSAFLRNHRLAAEARRDEARRREDEIAGQIYRNLLPDGDPVFEGLEISATCRAAESIGGDFYGYIPMPDGSLGVAMADVSGHGVGAALYMAAAKGALRAEARRVFAPGDLLRRVNEALAGDFSKSDVFATAFFARFYPGGRRFAFANGGHNPPLLIRARGDVELLERGGAALGVLPDMSYEEDIRRFGQGDVLVIYTDGLIEARDPQRRFYGLERMTGLVGQWRDESAATIKQRLLDDLYRHCGPDQHQDDVTLIVIRAVAGGEAGSNGRNGA